MLSFHILLEATSLIFFLNILLKRLAFHILSGGYSYNFFGRLASHILVEATPLI